MPILGLLIAALFYLTGTLSSSALGNLPLADPVRRLLFSGWGIDAIYQYLFIRPFVTLTQWNKNDAVDSLYLGIVWLSRKLHGITSATQTGRIRWYASSMALGSIVVIAIGLLS
jgi:NADH-quinone oxidoreductase subunit L